MIKVIIADDQMVLRESIKYRLDSDKEIKVVGCAATGFEVLELCKKYQPDVVLMDIIMPVCDGVKATKLIKEFDSRIKVIILTVFSDNENIKKAMRNGADGYVLKDINPGELVNIIRNTANGLRVIHQDVLDTIMSDFITYTQNQNENKFELSQKEVEIIKLIVEGESTKQIAANVFLSEGRVRNIISDILFKLDLKDRVQLAVFAIKHNIA